MGSHGSDYGRFRHALDSGNLTVALAAAAGLEYVGLAEALELLLLILDNEPQKFRRAALRWHGRYCNDQRDVDFAEAQAVLGLIAGLKGQHPKAAAEGLASLVHRRGLRQTSEALMRWADESQPSMTSFEDFDHQYGRRLPSMLALRSGEH